MKKIIKNTVDSSLFLELSQLLNQGFSIKNGLDLLQSFHQNKVINKMILFLDDGYSVVETMNFIELDPLFRTTFQCLFPFKGLSKALEEAYDFVSKKKKWMNLIKKQWMYPLFLTSIMAFFSLFVKIFLLPEMTRLFLSFETDISLKDSLNFFLISIIPHFLISIVCIVLFVCILIYYAVKKQNKRIIFILLRIPIISKMLQMYYSLIFAFYFSNVVSFFENMYETMDYMQRFFKQTELNIVIEDIIRQLNEGYTFDAIITNHKLLTHQFKKYFCFIFNSKQSFENLSYYCDFTFSFVKKRMELVSKILLGMMYLMTGIYILSLYSLMILPVLEITSSL